MNQMSVKQNYKEMIDRLNESQNPRLVPEIYAKILKTLLYIGYVSQMKDCMGNVITEDATKPYKSLKLLPIPFPESIPDLSCEGGWISAGLCHYFCYLDRNRMEVDFLNDIKKQHVRLGYYFDKRITKAEVASYIKCMVLSWEIDRTVYQYKTDTLHLIRSKTVDDLLLNYIPCDLLPCMPYNTLVLANAESGLTTLVSECYIKGNDQRKAKPLLFCMVWN